MKKRKMLALLLSLCMVLSVFPMSGIAAGAAKAVTGDGSKENPYQIANAADLTAFCNAVNNTLTEEEAELGYTASASACAVLTEDIVLNSNFDQNKFAVDESGIVTYDGDTEIPSFAEWTPIGSGRNTFTGSGLNAYTGSFVGNGHTVSGLYYNGDKSNVGLFGTVEEGGSVENLTVANSWIKSVGYNYVGGVVGNNYGSLTNCTNTGTVIGVSSVGGVVGSSYESTVKNCTNTGAVTGSNSYTGGVVGANYKGIVQNCTNTGTVTGDENVGGVVGNINNGSTVTSCTNFGAVTGSGNFVGGVAGLNRGTLTSCTNSAAVTGDAYVGGVAGENNDGALQSCTNTGVVTGSDSYIGGVTGVNYDGTLQSCINSGAVTGSDKIGGVAGRNYGNVTSSYNTGTVTGNENVGGVVGYQEHGAVQSSYNTGTVNGKTKVGGVAGDNSSTVTSCYYLNSTAAAGIGGGTVTGAAAKTKAEFESGTVATLLHTADNTAWSPENRAVPGSALTSQPVLAWQNQLAGDGTAEHPYQIYTAADLTAFRNAVNNTLAEEETEQGYTASASACAVLMADIDLNPGIVFGEDGAPAGSNPTKWTPIGLGSQSAWYTGSFSGNGHTVSGLYYNGTGDNVGLFGTVGADGTMENLTVANSWIKTAGDYVGSVVGRNSGTVTSCTSTGLVTGNNLVGGVAGYNHGTVISCTNTGAVTGNNKVGGVAGYLTDGYLTNCMNTGTVTGNNSVGGVMGTNYGNIQSCTNTGAVDGNKDVGGVVGYNYNSLTNSYNIGAVTGNKDVGGVAGWNISDNFTNSYNTGTVAGDEAAGGVAGANFGTLTGCYYLNSTAAAGVGGGNGTGDAAAKTKAEFESGAVATLLYNADSAAWNHKNKAVPGSSLAAQPVLAWQNRLAGDGSKEHPYLIYTAADLTAFRNAVNDTLTEEEKALGYMANTAACAVLMADIDLNPGITFGEDGVPAGSNPTEWTPIGSENENARYTGTFDGDGHSVSGLYYNGGGSSIGLFGAVGAGGKVENLTVANSYLKTTGDYIGGVAGRNYGAITNCVNSGTVTGSKYVGGVAGRNYGAVTSCMNTGAVGGNYYIGGVMGYQDSGTVTSCYNTGAVGGNNNYIGGVMGFNSDGTVQNCYNAGAVTGSSSVGGVVGYLSHGTVTNSYYLDSCVTNGTAIGTAKTEAEFASGEVAYLLGEAFGQTLSGTASNVIPLLLALSEAPTVYRITFTAYADSTHTVSGYYNAGQTAEIPEDFQTGYRFQNAAGDWQDTFPVTGDGNYTAIPAPTYTVSIPQDTTVDFNAQSTDFGAVEATHVQIDPGKKVTISVTTGALKNKEDETKTIPYSIQSEGKNFTSVDLTKQGDRVELTINITQEAWNAAYAGSYSGVATFTIEYVDMD